MALYGQGFSLRSLLENPNLQNPPNLNKGPSDVKKGGKLGGYVPNVNSAFLGSNLWDKPSNDNSNNSNDFDLEYMDLDEFLSENGIPVNPADNDESQTISLLASALAKSPSRSPNPGSPGLMIDPVSPSNPISVVVGEELGGYSNMSSPGRRSASPIGQITNSQLNINNSMDNTPQSVIEKYLLDDNFGIKMPSPKIAKMDESPRKRKMLNPDYSVNPNEISAISIPVYQQESSPIQSRQMVPSPSWEQNGSNYDSDDACNSDEENLMNNMIPGQDGFDPTSRKFSTEELKPQPIIKKAKKVFVNNESKDDRYWQRRKKNNIAAKRSREARRVKENQIAMRASFLERENDKLTKSNDKLLRENEDLRLRLSKYEKIE